MKHLSIPLLLASVLSLSCLKAVADWPQYRGATTDGITKETISTNNWEKNLKPLWKTELANGFSSFSVVGTRAFTIVSREVDGNPTEVLLALDTKDGKEVWAAPLGMAKYNGGGDSGTPDNKGGDGPRSTPSVDKKGRVYVTSAMLAVYCFDGRDGKKIWEHDLIKENNGANIQWQNAASPLLVDELVLCAGGGKGQALLALSQQDGKVVWKSEDDKMTHATPVLATILGVPQVIFYTQQGLVALDVKSGKPLWRHPFKYSTSTAASPVVWQDIVYCSAGYGVGAGACQITKTGGGMEAKELWRKENQLINHWSTPVVKDGFLYGMFSFKEYGKGPVACVDIKTGEQKWSQPGFGPGQIILAGDTLIALSDKGELVAIVPQPTAYKELARLDILDGKCWSLPVLSGGKIYARSTKEGGCWEVKG